MLVANQLRLVMLLGSVALAQTSNRVTLEGKIVDPTRAPIGGAHISAASQSGTVSAESGATGNFSLNLPKGEYMLNIQAQGFAMHSEIINLSENTSREITLEIEGV